MRHVLVEASHSHVRFVPGSRLSQFYQRISAKQGASKAAVTTAAITLDSEGLPVLRDPGVGQAVGTRGTGALKRHVCLPTGD